MYNRLATRSSNMHRYMIHLKNIDCRTPKDADSLLERARVLISDPKVIVRDTRVSRRNIEFDTSIPDSKNVHEILEKLLAISPVADYDQIVESNMDKEDAIRRAKHLFDEEKYWQAHEVLEAVWKNSKGLERDILNGIILVAAAFVHEQKNETEICISILKRATAKFDKASGVHYGIDIDAIANNLTKIIATGRIEAFAL